MSVAAGKMLREVTMPDEREQAIRLQDAMPRPGLPLVHFNDTRCGTVAELRAVMLKARRLAHDDVERERAVSASTGLRCLFEASSRPSAASRRRDWRRTLR
jgi:hypothetical protein